MRISTVLGFVIALCILGAATRSAATMIDAERASQVTWAVRICSITENPTSRWAPIVLTIWRHPHRAESGLSFADDEFADTEFGRCIRRHSHATPPHEGSVPRMHIVELHPWAGNSRRSWPEVRRHLVKRGVVAALKACDRMTDDRLQLWLEIDRQGDLTLRSPPPASADPNCFKRAAGLAAFPPSGNLYEVRVELGSRQTQVSGAVGYPPDCEVLGHPCAVEEQARLADLYFDGFEARARDLPADGVGALAWVRKQPHVVTANVDPRGRVVIWVSGPHRRPFVLERTGR